MVPFIASILFALLRMGIEQENGSFIPTVTNSTHILRQSWNPGLDGNGRVMMLKVFDDQTCIFARTWDDTIYMATKSLDNGRNPDGAWTFIKPPGWPYPGWFQLKNRATGKCLTMGSDPLATTIPNDTKILQRDCSNQMAPAQIFAQGPGFDKSIGMITTQIRSAASQANSNKCISASRDRNGAPYAYECRKEYKNQYFIVYN